MAMDLLESSSPDHIYRHDLESLFYVILWLTTRDNNGRTDLQDWNTLDRRMLRFEKSDLFHNELLPVALQPKEVYSPLKGAILTIKEAFMDGFYAQITHKNNRRKGINSGSEFDEATMGNNVTAAVFLEALKSSTT